MQAAECSFGDDSNTSGVTTRGVLVARGFREQEGQTRVRSSNVGADRRDERRDSEPGVGPHLDGEQQLLHIIQRTSCLVGFYYKGRARRATGVDPAYLQSEATTSTIGM